MPLVHLSGNLPTRSHTTYCWANLTLPLVQSNPESELVTEVIEDKENNILDSFLTLGKVTFHFSFPSCPAVRNTNILKAGHVSFCPYLLSVPFLGEQWKRAV